MMVIGERVTTYNRKSFQLKGIDDYRVLNVRMKYEGGVVAYLNGVKVGRFNLVEDFDGDTESMRVCSRCECILEVPHTSRIGWCKRREKWNVIRGSSFRGHNVI